MRCRVGVPVDSGVGPWFWLMSGRYTEGLDRTLAENDGELLKQLVSTLVLDYLMLTQTEMQVLGLNSFSTWQGRGCIKQGSTQHGRGST